MSATLRANQDLLLDKDAVVTLSQRGLYPVPSGPGGEVEILSANGELNVALEDGYLTPSEFTRWSRVPSGSDARIAVGARS